MSTMSDFLATGIRQLAFVVPDVEAAARDHSALTGSGPFFVMPRYRMAIHEHRGVPTELDVSSSYGWWGDIMVEFVQMHNEEPSAFRDAFPDGGRGMHHTAVWVKDLAGAVAAFEEAGYPITMYAERTPGLGYAMMDTRSALGFMLELYEESIVGPFYKMVRDASIDWDGSDPVRVREFNAFLAGSDE
ncbi:VOC family protein [Nocardia rhamnosiphila]|uniref:VOC family protein n=1 Tax=Nocardia rhamnosiphila TaxID=426716 RepID=A0ABV2WYS6_9NOCA